MNLAAVLKKVFNVNSKPSVADTEKLVEAAKQDVLDAQRAFDKAQLALDNELFLFMAKDDKIGAQRLRKGVRDARERLTEAKDDLVRAQRARDDANAMDAQASTAKRVKEAQQKALEWQRDIASLQDALAALALSYERCATSGLEFRNSLPTPLAESDLSMLWSPNVLASRSMIRLSGLSGGKFGNAGGFSTWQIMQGPDLNALARDTAARALSQQPKTEPTPPEAA